MSTGPPMSVPPSIPPLPPQSIGMAELTGAQLLIQSAIGCSCIAVNLPPGCDPPSRYMSSEDIVASPQPRPAPTFLSICRFIRLVAAAAPLAIAVSFGGEEP